MPTQLTGKEHDLGGFKVVRYLPNPKKKMVGPFIFFDLMGPGDFVPGEGVNVRPHPHIGLSTFTYLFSGQQVHRDSLGNHADVLPGDVNFMTAGKGIVHSEREDHETRWSNHDLHGLQCWIALPKKFTEIEPAFTHLDKKQLPVINHEGVMMRLLAGEAYGQTSPLRTYSPIVYVDVLAQKGSGVELPKANYQGKQELAVFVVEGELSLAGVKYQARDFVMIDDVNQQIEATSNVRFVIVGGEAFEEVPLIEWNFVAYTKERIEQAAQDWRDGKFATIPGDDREHIPY